MIQDRESVFRVEPMPKLGLAQLLESFKLKNNYQRMAAEDADLGGREVKLRSQQELDHQMLLMLNARAEKAKRKKKQKVYHARQQEYCWDDEEDQPHYWESSSRV